MKTRLPAEDSSPILHHCFNTFEGGEITTNFHAKMIAYKFAQVLLLIFDRQPKEELFIFKKKKKTIYLWANCRYFFWAKG